MESEILAWLSSDDGLRVHITIFAMLILGGLGLPIPEDIPIIFAGVAAAKNIVDPVRIFVTSYVGVTLADQMVYAFGYHFGNRLLDAGTRSKFFTSITEERINDIRDGLRRKRFIYIFIGRHLFPVRTATFITAGALRVPFVDFLIADLIAALVSVSAIMILGYTIGTSLGPEVIAHIAQQFQWYLTGFAAVIVAFLLIRRKARRRTSKS